MIIEIPKNIDKYRKVKLYLCENDNMFTDHYHISINEKMAGYFLPPRLFKDRRIYWSASYSEEKVKSFKLIQTFNNIDKFVQYMVNEYFEEIL